MKTHKLYTLICPISGHVKYVGKTTNPKSRYHQHLKDSEKNRTAKQKWILELQKKQLQPFMRVVEEFETEEVGRIAEEKLLISHIDTVLNIHMPGKGSLSVEHYRKTGKLTDD